MTLNEALELFGLDESTLSDSSIRKQYRLLARKYHPDANNGVDLGFNNLAEAYSILLDYIGGNSKSHSSNELSKYNVIFSYLIWSDIFGIDVDNDDLKNEVEDIYKKLDFIISDNGAENIEQSIKETIIDIFKLKYKKSFKSLYIDNPGYFFDKYCSEDVSLNDAFIALSYRYHLFESDTFRANYNLALRYLKHEELASYYVAQYANNLATSGISNDRKDFLNYIGDVRRKIIEKLSFDKGNLDDNFEKIFANYSDDSEEDILKKKVVFNDGDIVYDDSFGIGPLKMGVVVSDGEKQFVKYYIYSRTDSKVFRERLSTFSWKKLDELIDKGSLLGAKVIIPPVNSIERNGIIMYDDKILFGNSDYTKFAVSSEFRPRDYGKVIINMWPEYLSKSEIKRMIAMSVNGLVLGEERDSTSLSVTGDKVKKIGTYPDCNNGC